MTLAEEPMTSLADREALKGALEQAIADGSGVALAILDVDQCGRLWEQYGAEGGTRILDAVTTMVKDAASGQAYGISGDAYAILMPGTTVEQAFLRMEELRR